MHMQSLCSHGQPVHVSWPIMGGPSRSGQPKCSAISHSIRNWGSAINLQTRQRRQVVPVPHALMGTVLSFSKLHSLLDSNNECAKPKSLACALPARSSSPAWAAATLAARAPRVNLRDVVIAVSVLAQTGASVRAVCHSCNDWRHRCSMSGQ